MESNPGVVSTNRHDRQICAADLTEIRAIRGVTGEDDSISAGVDQVSGIAPICIRSKSRAPVIYLDSLYASCTDANVLSTPHFLHRPELTHVKKVAGPRRSDDCCSVVLQRTKRRSIEVIHMRFRQKNDIDLRK